MENHFMWACTTPGVRWDNGIEFRTVRHILSKFWERFVNVALFGWLRHLNNRVFLFISLLELRRRDHLNNWCRLFVPIIIMENHAKIKRWITLFTCLATRAVHLEVMETMSTEQCIQAFRKFISRRKQPKHIISDNLITAFKLLIELSRTESETMEWEFITSGVPWQGGVYERMIGAIKRSVRRTVSTKLLQN